MEDLEVEKYSRYKIVFLNEPERITEMRKLMPEEIKNKYEVTSSVPEYIEFVPKGIKKDRALQILCDKLNIQRHEVIAMGDVTDSNNNNGVAKAISKYLKID